ncbi:hypothetical protein CR513_55944, partial [Mucuna pruriens]
MAELAASTTVEEFYSKAKSLQGGSSKNESDEGSSQSNPYLRNEDIGYSFDRMHFPCSGTTPYTLWLNQRSYYLLGFTVGTTRKGADQHYNEMLISKNNLRDL